MTLFNNQVAIAGAGPIGSMLAVLLRLNGFTVTLYEKRAEATRAINLHTSTALFDQAEQLNPTDDTIFNELAKQLQDNHGSVLIRDLETILRTRAIELGVNYIEAEINNFDELADRHGDDALLIDAAGRHSSLRIDEFGGKENEKAHDVDHVMYLKITEQSGKRINPILYSVMKNIPGIKLARMLKSKTGDGETKITLAMTISSKLASLIPTNIGTSKNPYKPFASSVDLHPKINKAISAHSGNAHVIYPQTAK